LANDAENKILFETPIILVRITPSYWILDSTKHDRKGENITKFGFTGVQYEIR
jgi:hypothetical protein